MIYRYTDAEIKDLLKTMQVVVDSREQVNGHIIEYLDKKKVEHRVEKMEFGDYTALLPANPDMGIHRDMYLGNVLSIERKASLEELSGNLTKDRARIESEFLRAKGRVLLMVEGASYDDILNHNYNTQYDPRSFVATLKAFESRYGIQTTFISKRGAGNFLYHSLYYELRELLKNGFRKAI